MGGVVGNLNQILLGGVQNIHK